MSNKDISKYLTKEDGTAFSNDTELLNLAADSKVTNKNSGLTYKKTGANVFDKVPIEVETDAVLYTSQTLTDAQKQQARTNIGAGKAESVLYTAQSLTDAQKLQARTNIGVSDLSGVPLGTIVMWSSTTIPDGWSICNGQNGTPDLTGKFVIGVNSVYTVGSTGGAYDHFHYIGFHTGDNSGKFYVNGDIHNDSDKTNSVVNVKTPTKQGLINSITFGNTGAAYVDSEIKGKSAHWNGDNGGGITDQSFYKGNMITSRGYGDSLTQAGCLPPYYALYYIMKTSGNDSTASGGTAASASQVETLSNLITQLQARISVLESSSGSGGSGAFTLGNEFTATIVSIGKPTDPIPVGTIITPNLYHQGDGSNYGGSSQTPGRWTIYQGTGTGSSAKVLSSGSYIVTQQSTISTTQLGNGNVPYGECHHTLKLRKITGISNSSSSSSSSGSSQNWGTTLFETVSHDTNGTIVKTINQPVPEGTIVKLFSVTQFSTGSDSSGNGSGIPVETKRFYVWKANGYTLTNEDKTAINNLTSRYSSPYQVTYDSGTI